MWMPACIRGARADAEVNVQAGKYLRKSKMAEMLASFSVGIKEKGIRVHPMSHFEELGRKENLGGSF